MVLSRATQKCKISMMKARGIMARAYELSNSAVIRYVQTVQSLGYTAARTAERRQDDKHVL